MNRFLDSFQHYDTAGLLAKWTQVITSSPTIQTSGGRTQARHLRTSNGNGVYKTLDAQGAWTVGFALRVADVLLDNCILMIRDGGTTQVSLWVEASTGKLKVYRGNTTALLGTTSHGVAVGQWTYVELKVTIHDSTGTVNVQIAGVNRLALTGQDTKATGNATADQIALASASGESADFCDLYIHDGTGSSPDNTFWGDTRVKCTWPSSDPATSGLNQWTADTGSAKHARCSETVADGDTSYASTETGGQRQHFGMAALSGLSSTVRGVQVCGTVRKEGTGTVGAKLSIRPGSTNYDGSEVTLGTTYACATERWAKNPDTDLAWTLSQVNASLPGIVCSTLVAGDT